MAVPNGVLPTTYTIDAPGSYYLTGNCVSNAGTAIIISSSNVTLDLNGYSITSTGSAPAGSGVLLTGVISNIHIHNGSIAGTASQTDGVFSGGGFVNGISTSAGPQSGVQVSRVSVSRCQNSGINLAFGKTTLIDSCAADSVGGVGLLATGVVNSVAWACGGDGIDASNAANCIGHTLSDGTAGVHAMNASDCYGACDGANGFGLIGFNATNCFGTTSGSGSIGLSGTTCSNCYGYSGHESSGEAGITATTANNCVGYSVSGSGLGAFSAANCRGDCESGADHGLVATIARGCYGACNGAGVGVYAYQVASDCYGISVSGYGISANCASNCSGVSNSSVGVTANLASNCLGASSSAAGIIANCVSNSYGSSHSGIGLSAEVASNSYGLSNSSYGVYANVSAIGCYGSSLGNSIGLYANHITIGSLGDCVTGFGLHAIIANSCIGLGTNGSDVLNKYNMP